MKIFADLADLAVLADKCPTMGVIIINRLHTLPLGQASGDD